MGFLKGILKSKKLGSAVAGILGIVLTQVMGLPEEFAAKIVSIVMSYIAAQGVVDLGLALKGSKTE